MSSNLYVVIAALGSSALTGLVALGLEWWRSFLARKAARAERRSRAYSLLLTRSMVVAHQARDLHRLIEVRSALPGSISTTSLAEQLIPPLEAQMNQLRIEVVPLYEAWFEVWVVGSQAAIREADELFTRCVALMESADQRTPQQMEHWQEAARGVAQARWRLAKIARKEIGVEVADLNAGNELGDPVR
jgi:hypothetical protein